MTILEGFSSVRVTRGGVTNIDRKARVWLTFPAVLVLRPYEEDIVKPFPILKCFILHGIRETRILEQHSLRNCVNSR